MKDKSNQFLEIGFRFCFYQLQRMVFWWLSHLISGNRSITAYLEYLRQCSFHLFCWTICVIMIRSIIGLWGQVFQKFSVKKWLSIKNIDYCVQLFFSPTLAPFHTRVWTLSQSLFTLVNLQKVPRNFYSLYRISWMLISKIQETVESRFW